MFLTGEALPLCLLLVFSLDSGVEICSLLLVLMYFHSDLYSVNSLILVKNGIDFLNMHII